LVTPPFLARFFGGDFLGSSFFLPFKPHINAASISVPSEDLLSIDVWMDEDFFFFFHRRHSSLSTDFPSSANQPLVFPFLFQALLNS